MELSNQAPGSRGEALQEGGAARSPVGLQPKGAKGTPPPWVAGGGRPETGHVQEGLAEQVATWTGTGARLLAAGQWSYKHAEGGNGGPGDNGVG